MTYFKTGHFTQLIWRGSRRMGVGVSIAYNDGSKRGPCSPSVPLYMIYVVVKYDPAGNFQTYESYMNNVKSPIS
ncbi:hypothetical protein ANCDUO_06289 [Ancylostoma duodenale]|uniref:Uncharacterized protein n=1 Tax=Ancylostoma duodenale TaxID=51022 RepID=A0A0C2GWI9_9BILA|nr:hypothetical protein ANCDUO_06289 [Ancylostoma duodenale]